MIQIEIISIRLIGYTHVATLSASMHMNTIINSRLLLITHKSPIAADDPTGIFYIGSPGGVNVMMVDKVTSYGIIFDGQNTKRIGCASRGGGSRLMPVSQCAHLPQ